MQKGPGKKGKRNQGVGGGGGEAIAARVGGE